MAPGTSFLTLQTEFFSHLGELFGFSTVYRVQSEDKRV